MEKLLIDKRGEEAPWISTRKERELSKVVVGIEKLGWGNLLTVVKIYHLLKEKGVGFISYR
jgi:hypothetical protein